MGYQKDILVEYPILTLAFQALIQRKCKGTRKIIGIFEDVLYLCFTMLVPAGKQTTEEG